MTLYLLLAIALGALSGVAEVPAARPGFAGVVARSVESRAKRQAIAARGYSTEHVRQPRIAALTSLPTRRTDAPLSGAASPRAPSCNS